VATVVYLLNRSLTKALQGMTLFEGWYGKKPAAHHLCTFKYLVHVKMTMLNLKKLDDCSKPMIFIGYEPGSKAFRAYDPVSKRVHVTRDVVFDEQSQCDWSTSAEQELEAGGDTFRVEMEHTTTVHDAQGAPFMPGTLGSASLVGSVPPPQSPIHDAEEGIGITSTPPIVPASIPTGSSMWRTTGGGWWRTSGGCGWIYDWLWVVEDDQNRRVEGNRRPAPPLEHE
jgi:hypothetical protein